MSVRKHTHTHQRGWFTLFLGQSEDHDIEHNQQMHLKKIFRGFVMERC